MKASNYTKETIKNIGVIDRNFPEFGIGDTIAVSLRIKEGSKERIQIFQGDVIAFHNNGIASTFMVRKIGANNISVEQILPLYSPIIKEIKFIRKGKVRRAKLFYLRDRVGKAARIKEHVLTKEEKLARGIGSDKAKAKKAKETAKAAEEVKPKVEAKNTTQVAAPKVEETKKQEAKAPEAKAEKVEAKKEDKA